MQLHRQLGRLGLAQLCFNTQQTVSETALKGFEDAVLQPAKRYCDGDPD
jgi:hypothetical protein